MTNTTAAKTATTAKKAPAKKANTKAAKAPAKKATTKVAKAEKAPAVKAEQAPIEEPKVAKDGTARGTKGKITGAVKGKRIAADKTYTVAETAELVGTTTAAVQRWIRLEYVPATKAPVGDSKRVAFQIKGSDLAAFLKARA